MNYIQPYTKLLYMCIYLIYSDQIPIIITIFSKL